MQYEYHPIELTLYTRSLIMTNILQINIVYL